MKVLLERDERTGLGKRGYTDNYLRVEVAPDNTCFGLQSVHLKDNTETGLTGEVVS